MAVGGLAPTTEGNAVVLMDEGAKRALVLYGNGAGAHSVAVKDDHRHVEQSLARNLLRDFVQKLGGNVLSVRVDRVENEIFYGSVLLAKGGRLVEMDARPGDALALALGNAVPVFVAETVLDQAGIDVDRFDFRKLRDAPPNRTAGRVEVAL
jgi:bifunctional DNase/RNase